MTLVEQSAKYKQAVEIFGPLDYNDQQRFKTEVTNFLSALTDEEILALANEMRAAGNDQLRNTSLAFYNLWNADLLAESARVGSGGRLTRHYPYKKPE